jgi:hypothetical protein
VNCQLRGFDDDVNVFSQLISPVHGFSIFHSTDQIVHHLCSTAQDFSLSNISDQLSYCHSILWVLRIFHLLGVLWPECSMLGSGLWRLLRLPVPDPLGSGWTECSMLWSGLLLWFTWHVEGSVCLCSLVSAF